MSTTGNLKVNAELADNTNDSKIGYSGSTGQLLNQKDFESIGISIQDIEKCFKKKFNSKPNKIITDIKIYKQNKIEPASIKFNINKINLIRADRQPKVINSQTYINNSNTPQNGSGQISKTVWDTVSTQWTVTNDFSYETQFSLDLTPLGLGVKSQQTLSYKLSIGVSQTTQQSNVVSYSTTANVTIPAKTEIVVYLWASYNSAGLNIEFQEKYEGNIIGSFGKQNNYKTITVQELLQFKNIPTSNVLESQVNVEFYSNSQITYDENNLTT